MGEIVGIVSGKGGVGKTTVSANLGLAMQEFGERVIVVDADMGGANLGLHLGQNHLSSTLHKAIEEDVALSQLISIHPTGLRIIPASVSPAITDFDAEKMRRKLEEMENTVILDSPPGLDQHARRVLQACDSVIIVAVPEITSATDAMKIKYTAEDYDVKVKGTILNRTGSSKYNLTREEIKTGFDLDVIGEVPEDEKMKKSYFQREPVLSLNPHAKSSIAFKEIAADILGKRFEPPKLAPLKRWLSGVK